MMENGRHGSGVRSMFHPGGASNVDGCRRNKGIVVVIRKTGDMDEGVKGTKPPGAAKRPLRLHRHVVTGQSNTAVRTHHHSVVQDESSTPQTITATYEENRDILYMCVAYS